MVQCLICCADSILKIFRIHRINWKTGAQNETIRRKIVVCTVCVIILKCKIGNHRFVTKMCQWRNILRNVIKIVTKYHVLLFVSLSWSVKSEISNLTIIYKIMYKRVGIHILENHRSVTENVYVTKTSQNVIKRYAT